MGNNLSKFGSTFITSTRVKSCWVRAANGKLKRVSFSVRCGSEGELKEHLKENRVLIQEADCSCSHCLYLLEHQRQQLLHVCAFGERVWGMAIYELVIATLCITAITLCFFFYTVVKAFKAVCITIESTQPDQVCIRVVWYLRGYQT